MVTFMPQPLYTMGKNFRAIEQEVGLALDLFCTFWKRERSLAPARVSAPTIQSVA
jgi:hypothetical protein